ncbi:MAG: T9SS type A sorting domain-containing protein [Bacteroidota bacterium]
MKSKIYLFTFYFILFSTLFKTHSYGQCTSNTSLYPSTTFTPNCNGTTQNILTDGWAEEYSRVYVTSGTTYTFSSSVASDYLTIANTAGGAPIYAFGTTPVIWTASITGPVRFYNNTNSSCGTNQLNRTRSVKCGTAPTPPANDNCSTSFSVPVNASSSCVVTSTATSVNATQSQSGCSGTADDDVWFSFTASATSHTITVSPGSITDIVLQVFSGTCGSLTSLKCEDGPTASNPEIATLSGLTVNSVYYFRVHSFGNGSGAGTFTMCITTPPAPPANDNCSGSFTVPVNSSNSCAVTGTATSVNATQSQSGCSGTADDDVWFKFTASATTHTITVSPATINDIVLQVFSGSCGSLSSITCEDGPTASNPEIATLSGLTINSVYYFRVHSFGNATGAGTFTVCITSPPAPPANDNCSGSFSVTVNPTTSCATSFTATSVSATQSQAGCTANSDDDVWFNFTAISTSQIITVTQLTMPDAVFQIFSGSCGSLSSIGCVDAGSGTETTTLSGLTIGTTYYVRVYGYGNASDAGTFSICITTPYDPCSSIANIAICGSTINATTSSGAGAYSSSSCGYSTPGKELIYTFTPGTSGVYNIQQFSSYGYIDYQYKVASSGCSSSGWSCFDNLTGAATSANTASLAAGVQYYILLDPEVNTGGNISFTIKCPPTPPTNDDCPGAASVAVSSGSTCTSLTNGTLYGSIASSQANGCNSGNDDHDVWYSFVSTSSSHSITINSVAGLPTDLYHSVYAGSCATPGPAIVCSDPNNSTVNGLILGNTYYIRIYTNSASANPTTTFSVCIKTGPNIGACGNPITNDYCSNPATLTQGAGTFSSSTSSIYSSDQASPLSGIFCGSIENNSWYQFIATSSTASFPFTSITNCDWGDGVQAHVYSVSHNASGCCTAFNSVSNCYNPGTSSSGTVNATGLTVGQIYVLMVDGYAGDVCDFTVSGWTAVGILPMELLTFVGRNEGEKNKLEWVTASEKNSNYFTIEKSDDGSEFEKIMDVGANGMSNSPKNYSAFDMNPFQELTYYRLKLVNIDDSYEYSNIISINNKNLTDYISNARPNPTNGNLEFDVNINRKEKILISIYNNNGALISAEQKNLEEGYRTLNVDLNTYNSGIYLLKVSFENSGKIEIQKIIKY